MSCAAESVGRNATARPTTAARLRMGARVSPNPPRIATDRQKVFRPRTLSGRTPTAAAAGVMHDRRTALDGLARILDAGAPEDLFAGPEDEARFLYDLLLDATRGRSS